MKKFLTMWQLWATISMVLVLILAFNKNALTGMLPFAVFLICPLMMFFMMKDHHKH